MYENDYKNGLDGVPIAWTMTIQASKEKQRLLSIRNNEPEKNLKFITLPPRDGKGDGTPLQYSCLENPMDRGAW